MPEITGPNDSGARIKTLEPSLLVTLLFVTLLQLSL